MTDRTLPTEGTIASDETLDASSGEPRSSSIRAPLPARLGRYRVIGLLGRGGMGAVYAAEDPELGRRVAIKMLRDEIDATDREDLRREAQALARLVHPNVVTVHDVGTADHRVFLVMQLVDGDSIDAWAKATHARPAAIVAAFRQAGRGLAAAHDAGLVHRDVKPSNILVDRHGDVRVSDFGVAQIETERATGDSGRIAGTPAYMAPEQLAGHATAASDQFSFCVALWEVLAGKRPFEAESNATTADGVRDVVRSRPRLPGVPRNVQRALARGLAVDPSARFPTMAALVAALGPPRWRRIVAIASLAAVAIGVTAVIAARASREPPAPAHEPPPAPGRPDIAAVHHLTAFATTACAYAPTIGSDNAVVFDRTAGDAVDLYAVPLAGGEPARLTSAPTWEWRAHQGRRTGEVIHLITSPKTTDDGQIAYLDLASHAETIAATVSANDAIAIGNVVYYTSFTKNEIRRSMVGRDELLVRAAPGQEFIHLAAAPGGERIATVGGNVAGGARLCLIDVAAARAECLPDRVNNVRPAFGSGGRFVYYTAAGGLHRRDVTSARDDVILDDVVAEGGIAVAPDGRTLVYSTCGSHTQIVDTSTSPPKVVVADGSTPSVASDGALVYLRTRGGKRVAIVRAADGKETQVTPPEAIRAAALSPDGQYVALALGGQHPGIYARKVADGQLEQLTDSARDYDPYWLAGDTVAFTRMDDHDLPGAYVVKRDGSVARRVGAASRHVLAAHGREVLVAGIEYVYWLDVDTGAERTTPPQPEHATNATVSPSARWLAGQIGNTRQVAWRVDTRDPHAKPESVLVMPTGQTGAGIAVTDAGHVLADVTTWSGDLVVVPAAAGSTF
jgi:hypothetical protein